MHRSFVYSRKVEGLEHQLGYERLRREKLEAELDECRNEIVRLINTLRMCEEKNTQIRVSGSINRCTFICY